MEFLLIVLGAFAMVGIAIYLGGIAAIDISFRWESYKIRRSQCGR